MPKAKSRKKRTSTDREKLGKLYTPYELLFPARQYWIVPYGTGGSINRYLRNNAFRWLVDNMRPEYLAKDKIKDRKQREREKRAIALWIIRYIHFQQGRFVEWDIAREEWIQVLDENRLCNKTMQALRQDAREWKAYLEQRHQMGQASAPHKTKLQQAEKTQEATNPASMIGAPRVTGTNQDQSNYFNKNHEAAFGQCRHVGQDDAAGAGCWVQQVPHDGGSSSHCYKSPIQLLQDGMEQHDVGSRKRQQNGQQLQADCQEAEAVRELNERGDGTNIVQIHQQQEVVPSNLVSHLVHHDHHQLFQQVAFQNRFHGLGRIDKHEDQERTPIVMGSEGFILESSASENAKQEGAYQTPKYHVQYQLGLPQVTQEPSLLDQVSPLAGRNHRNRGSFMFPDATVAVPATTRTIMVGDICTNATVSVEEPARDCQAVTPPFLEPVEPSTRREDNDDLSNGSLDWDHFPL